MFSMGSGITAVYHIAKSIVENELEETKIHLIGGFKNILQIPLKKELQILSDYWNFKCTLHISQIQSNSDIFILISFFKIFFFSKYLFIFYILDVCNIHGINIKSGRLDKKSIFEVLKNKIASTTLILICGTSQFNNYVEQWIKCMNYRHIHVFK